MLNYIERRRDVGTSETDNSLPTSYELRRRETVGQVESGRLLQWEAPAASLGSSLGDTSFSVVCLVKSQKLQD